MHDLEQQFIATIGRIHFHSEVTQYIDDLFSEWQSKNIDFSLAVNGYVLTVEVLHQFLNLTVIPINYRDFAGLSSFCKQFFYLHGYIYKLPRWILIFADNWLYNQIVKTRVGRLKVFIQLKFFGQTHFIIADKRS